MSLPRDHGQVQSPSNPTSANSPRRPTLLPAFTPCSSSPSLPRPSKRKFGDSPSSSSADLKQYPTPVPTSSTDVLRSSLSIFSSTRPGLKRTASTASERVPLGNVPSVELPLSGEPVLMGRSSNSSHFQLSANRLISRIHVRAEYRAASRLHEDGEVVIQCLGWNGAKVNCRGQTFMLAKEDSFSSDKRKAEIMLDVQDARVLIRWPTLERKGSVSAFSEATLTEEGSPSRAMTPTAQLFPSSPPQMHAHLQSPVSPSPRDRPILTASSTFIGLPLAPSSSQPVEVYEDHASSDDDGQPSVFESSAVPEPESTTTQSKASQSGSVLSEPDDFSDQDEENDPIVYSFGPFGDNLLPRMASFHAVSPERRRHPLETSTSPQQRLPVIPEQSTDTLSSLSPVRNHVINQLAFSRLHSLPLSTILNNLPALLKDVDGSGLIATSFSSQDLKKLLNDIPCIGGISRAGKDAAGKPLEDEFYYVAEMDADEIRRTAVQESLGPGLRSVRKQHKQYYWKKPRY